MVDMPRVEIVDTTGAQFAVEVRAQHVGDETEEALDQDSAQGTVAYSKMHDGDGSSIFRYTSSWDFELVTFDNLFVATEVRKLKYSGNNLRHCPFSNVILKLFQKI